MSLLPRRAIRLVFALVSMTFFFGALLAPARARNLGARERELVGLLREVDAEGTDPETFGERWTFLRRYMLHREHGSAAPAQATLARVLNLRALFAQDRGRACRRLDTFLRDCAAALGKESRPEELRAVDPVGDFHRPSAASPKTVRSPAPREAAMDEGAFLRLARDVEREPTTKKSFLRRWTVLADFVKSLPVRARKQELFGYAEVVRCKLSWYQDASGAAMALDEFVDQARNWLRSRS